MGALTDTSLIAIQIFGLEIGLIILIPVFGFVAIAVATWSIMDMMAGAKERGRRLDRLQRNAFGYSEPNSQRTQGARTNAMLGILSQTAPKLSKHLTPNNQKDASKLKQKLLHAGFRQPEAQAVFLGSKVIGLLGGAVLGGAVFLIMSGFSTSTLIRTALFAGFFFYLPDLVIWYKTRKRKEQIFLGLPDVLDLMVVCVEAGLGLDQAMRKVSDEMKKSFPVLSDEFGLCNVQLQMGRPRTEVLNELGLRTGVEDLRALATIILQADKFGSSIAQALRVQSESMRTRRRQLAEEKAAKTAVQLIFPLVMFIFPAIFVVLVGPAAITMVNEMMPMMQKSQSQGLK